MKKVLIIGILLFGVLVLTACKEDEKPDTFVKHWVGDIVTRNGIIYEFVNLGDNHRNIFSFEKADEKELYHSYYYFDMVNTNQAPLIPFPDESDPEFAWTVLKASDYSYFKGLKYFNTEHFLRITGQFFQPVNEEDKNLSRTYGFIVKGYTDEIKKDVQIPRTIDRYLVFGIGYKAFLNAPIETLVFKQEIGFIMPYGLDSLPNLKSVVLPEYSALFSMAISNCPMLKEVDNAYKTIDASLYNLPNLERVSLTYTTVNPGNLDWLTRGPRVLVGTNSGLYRSSFYLCPKLEEITGIGIFCENNTYFRREYSFYDEERRIIFVKDDFVINVSKIETYSWMVNEQENSLYVPYLNDGLVKKGEFIVDENDFVKKINDKIYYRPAIGNMWCWDELGTSGRGEFFHYKTNYQVS